MVTAAAEYQPRRSYEDAPTLGSVHPVTQKLIDRSPERLRRPVDLSARTVDGALGDRLPGLAAEIAFWVLLSLPALVLAGIASLGSIGTWFGGIDAGQWQRQLMNRVTEVARVGLTETTVENVVRPLLEQLLQGGGIGLISFAFLTAVWTASRAVRVVLTTVTIVYDRDDTRPAWLVRLLGMVVTIGALLLGAVLAPLLIAGPNFGEQLAEWVNVDLGPLPEVWARTYWPGVIVLATAGIATLYHLGVPGRTRWRHDLPGAILATVVWLAGSAGLRLYALWSLNSQSIYGPMAGPIVALLWLWLTALAVLLGGELNAQLDHRRRARGAEEETRTARASASPPADGGRTQGHGTDGDAVTRPEHEPR